MKNNLHKKSQKDIDDADDDDDNNNNNNVEDNDYRHNDDDVHDDDDIHYDVIDGCHHNLKKMNSSSAPQWLEIVFL